MAKKDRTKELWHIPKRGSVHQTIYMVYMLTWDKLINKAWTQSKQEFVGTEMGKAGLTKSGKSISHQSVRTLLANVPKYLGFVMINNSTTPSIINVTNVGKKLIAHHRISEVQVEKNLDEYEKKKVLITKSEIFKLQMSKLLITNPVINTDCQNILLFPFLTTLKLISELEFLDIEEIAYILFRMKSPDEYDLIKTRITNFRKIDKEDRDREISEYRKTNEGNLTLVKAPTARYFMYLCESTGLCAVSDIYLNQLGKNKRALTILDHVEAERILSNHDINDVYDFKNNLKLWYEYFGDPQKTKPPFDLTIRIKSKDEQLIIINHLDDLVFGGTSNSENQEITFPVFSKEKYDLTLYDFNTGNVSKQSELIPTKQSPILEFKISNNNDQKQETVDEIVKGLHEISSKKFDGFDQKFLKKIQILNKILGISYQDSNRRGARLEQLFYNLLDQLRVNNIIDDLVWYGDIGQYGIPKPAPGGKYGNPDITFTIDDHLFVLELTTIYGNRGQWNSSEASSVPDHIISTHKKYPEKHVVGIFCAPTIHSQLKRNLELHCQDSGVKISFIQIDELADLLSKTDKKSIVQEIESKKL